MEVYVCTAFRRSPSRISIENVAILPDMPSGLKVNFKIRTTLPAEIQNSGFPTGFGNAYYEKYNRIIKQTTSSKYIRMLANKTRI
jgi:hypothetical protein